MILHAHLPQAELLSIILGFLLRKKVIVSKHNAEPFASKLGKKISLILARFVNRNASDIVFISEAAKKFAVMNEEVVQNDFSKMHVIHYGMPLDLQETVVPRKRNLECLQNEVLRIGTLSRLESQKDLSTLIQACVILKKRGVKALCEIYGRGSLEKELRKEIVELGLENFVLLQGFTHDKFDVLARLDLFVLSSKYEGFGLVLLEAMAARVPIVSSNSDAAIEVLGSNSPCLFESGDALSLSNKIIEIGSNISLQNAIVNNYKERLQMFSADTMFRQMMNLYQNDN